VIQDGTRSWYRTDDLFHEVEAVKAFPTPNWKSLTPASSQTMMDLLGMESTTSSMEMDAVKGVCSQMLPRWKRGTL
jgi:hypothetical protein